MIARPVWLPLLLLAARAWAIQQGHNDDNAQAAPASHQVKLSDQVAELFHRSPLGGIADAIAPGAVAPRSPLQTPPPPQPRLRARQVDGQVAALSAQIQSLSLASSSVSQASRLVSQTSQQLAQQVTQLSQSTDRLTQSIFQLQASAQQASQSAQQASQSAQQASQSAQQAQQSAQRASQSASSAISSAITSAQSSASSVIAAASASVIKLANAAQSAQADATGARADADTQVQRAQGTAVSVTQAAVAIVVTFFVSSLLTIGAFYLLLRYKSKQKRRRTQLIATRGTEFGKPDDANRNANAGAHGYPVDLKNPPPRKPIGPGNNEVGGSSDNPFGDDKEEKRRPSSDYRPREDRDSSGDVGYGLGVFASAVKVNQVKIVDNNPLRPPPSLQQWISEGTVSPFGTLRREDSTADSNTIGQAITSGPGDAQPRAAMTRPMGVGGVNGGGGSRVMRPGKTLPFRVQ